MAKSQGGLDMACLTARDFDVLNEVPIDLTGLDDVLSLGDAVNQLYLWNHVSFGEV